MSRLRLEPEDIHSSTSPFPHASIQDIVGSDVEVSLLKWFRSDAPWRLKIASFYEQHEVSLHSINLPAELQFLTQPETVGAIQGFFSREFNARLQTGFELTAHRLSGGQRIRLHNDFRPAGESHRLLIQINSSWRDEDGGLLMLFADEAVASLTQIVPPISRSGFAFEISRRSYHAVSPVARGERFTLVYSFYPESSHERSGPRAD